MRHSTNKPTKAEAARMARLKDMVCVACQIYGTGQMTVTEVHHLLSGNKRRGHMFTIPLCSHHHRGTYGDPARSDFVHGPSLARSSKKFHAVFGTDDELLEQTNRLLEGK